MNNRGEFKVPIELLGYGLREKFISPLRLYLLLKSMCDGKLIITDQVIQDLAGKLGYKSTKSVRNNLDKLYVNGWLTLSKRSGYTFIKGFELIRKEKGFERRTAAILNENDLNHLRSFATAAVITSLIQSQKRRAAISVAKGKHGSARKARKRPLFYPISTVILAKILNCSQMQASRLRTAAVKAGYLDMRKPKLIKTGVKLSEYKHFIENTQIEKKLRVKNNQVFYQDAFLIKSNLCLKKRISLNI